MIRKMQNGWWWYELVPMITSINIQEIGGSIAGDTLRPLVLRELIVWLPHHPSIPEKA